MTKTELRRYCRQSGHCTRLSKNRIMLHQDDIEKIVAWVREQNTVATAQETEEIDPFA